MIEDRARELWNGANRWLRRSRRNSWLAGGAAAAIVVGGPWMVVRAWDDAEPTATDGGAVRVAVAPVEVASPWEEARFTGALEPHRAARLSFNQPGRIIDRLVDLGDRLEAGAPLLQLERVELDLETAAAEASMVRSRADLEHGTRHRERVTTLLGAEAAPAFHLDDAVRDEKLARATRREARSRLRRVQRAKRDTVLRAPFDGLVTAVLAEVGEHVGAGTLVVEIADDRALRLELEIPETWIGNVTESGEVNIALPLQGRSLGGRVKSVGNASRRGGLFPVVIEIPATEGVRPGMMAELTLVRERPSAVFVPVEAIVNRSGSGAQVYRVESDAVQPVDVSVLGLSEQGATISGEIEPGASVVVRGHVGLYDGKRVDATP